MPLKKKRLGEFGARAIYAPLVTIYPIVIQKGCQPTNRGIHIQKFTDLSLFVFFKTKQNSQFELTVGGIQSLHTTLL
jgi:hypothetical protein